MLETPKTGEALRLRLRAILDEIGMKPAELARRCSVNGQELSSQAVYGWLKTGRVDKKWLPLIEMATGRKLGFSAPVVSGLAEALEILSMSLAALDPSMREAVATNLAGWARDGGREHWKRVLLSLLEAPSEKRQAVGT